MQRSKPAPLPPIPQQNAAQLANSYGPHEVFIEGAISRFEQRMDRMLAIMQNGFENFNLAQNRTAKRIGKIYNRLDVLTKHICGPGDHKESEQSNLARQRSLEAEEDNGTSRDEQTNVMNSLFTAKFDRKPQQHMQAIPVLAIHKSNTSSSSLAQPKQEEPAPILTPHQISYITREHSIVEPEEEIEHDKQQVSQPEIDISQPPVSSVAEKALTKLGEYRDHIIILPLDEPIDGKRLIGKQSLEEIRAFLCKWVGRVADMITKEAFHGFYSKEMNELEMRVFLCNHMILAFHQMVAYLKKHYAEHWNPHKEELIHMFQQQLSLALEYYLVKYPQKNKVFLNAQLRDLIPEKNDLAQPQFHMINRLTIRFNPLDLRKIFADTFEDPRQMDFTQTMKLFINALIQEAKTWNEEFKKLMQRVFTVGAPPQGPKPLDDFKLSMKFKEDTSPFSEEEIKNPGVPIHSPEVLRILIKWIEEIDSMLHEPEKNILERDELVGGGSQIETIMLSRYNKELAGLIVEYYHKEFDENSSDRSIMDSAFNSLHDYVRHHRPQFNYLPESTVSCGMTVNLMSTLTCDIAVLYLGKLIGFFYAMHTQCLKKIGEQGVSFLKLDKQLLPFTVCDLLRARCSCTVTELATVLNNLKKAPGVTIVRVKNRLDTGNRDFLINFTFSKCRLMCEVQVGLKDTADQKGSYLHHFNHFLYELKRSKFGPMSQSALIIANIIDVGAYFRQKTGARRSIKDILKFDPRVEDNRIKIDGFEMLRPNFSFLCNNCLESCSNRMLPPWKNLKQDEYLCGRCVYHKLNAQQRAIYALGEDIGPFYEEVDWKFENSKKSDYLVVLTSENLAKIDFYSTKEPDGPMTQSKAFYGDINKDVYYRCFGNLQTFISAKNFKNNKIYRLKTELVDIPIKIDHALEGDNKTPWFIDISKCTEEAEDISEQLPYLVESGIDTKFRVCYAFSNTEDVQPKYIGVARCAIDLDRRCVLLLDNDRDRATFVKCKEAYVQERLQSRNMSNQWKTEWNYEKKNFQDELLLGMPDDDAVECVKMSFNAFTRLDILRTVALKKLHLNHNKICKPMVTDNHYPNLQQLQLINNGIMELDFTVLRLPQLETLDMSINHINKIHTLRSKSKEVVTTVTLQRLKIINLRFNRLSEFDVVATDFPELEDIALSFNPLTKLDFTGFKNLYQLRASFTKLTSFVMAGDYPKLDGLFVTVTTLEECDLSQCTTPKLKSIYLSYNSLEKIKLPLGASDLGNLSLQYNYLTEVTIGAKGTDTYPKLKELFLQFNSLKKLDITALGGCPSMTNLNIAFNDDMKLIAAASIDITKGYLNKEMPYPTDDTFRKWMLMQMTNSQREAFKQKLFKDNPGFPMKLWTEMYNINDSIYTKAMDIQVAEATQNTNNLNLMWTAFKDFHAKNIKPSPTAFHPQYAGMLDRTMNSYTFLKEKKVEPGVELIEGDYEDIIPSFTVPVGSKCQDCGKVLTVPYYYGISSKVHRCRQCCEKENQGFTNPLNRYVVNENSILVMGQQVVDVVRMGTNVQPSNEKECSPHNIACNGCLSNKVGGKPRYVCMGCRREPTNFKDGYVDFCYGCMTKLCGTKEQQDSVMKICEKDGHKPDHTLLRILYRVVNYYKY